MSSPGRFVKEPPVMARTISSASPPMPQSPDGVVNPYSASPTMPADFSISVGEKGSTDRWLAHPPTERRQEMRGFDPTYVDIVDYILRVTHRIWEEKEI